MTNFLAQTDASNPGTAVTGILDAIPLSQIASLIAQVMPEFIAVAVVILFAGHSMRAAQSEKPFRPVVRLALLFLAMASSLWWAKIGQQIANGLVTGIGNANPDLNWLVVNNPGDDALAVDFGPAYKKIAQWVAGNFGSVNLSVWDLVIPYKSWFDYSVRGFFIATAGFVAALTVFLMEATLVLQKMILIGSRPFFPVFVAALSLPAVQGSAQNFFKGIVGVTCWPVGWAIAHLWTMGLLQKLQTPDWNASLSALPWMTVTLVLACLWMLIATMGAPAAIMFTVYNGSNFAGHLMGATAASIGHHAANVLKAGGAVVGGAAGIAGGPDGVAAGASIGSSVGAAAAEPVRAASSMAESATHEPGSPPSRPAGPSRSEAAADAVLRAIKKAV